MMIKTTFHHIQVIFQNLVLLIFQLTSMFLLLYFLQNTTFINNNPRFLHIIILSSSFSIKPITSIELIFITHIVQLAFIAQNMTF